ncbi:MAG: ectoine hydroxylase-related dioxygenase (phytanoyl-CoA dioxygenase family) [Halioglobus sp.]|jgi:ectoine hydroxylase-related dioxygenase (phytanoyl-CoA dioxygenase family)
MPSPDLLRICLAELAAQGYTLIPDFLSHERLTQVNTQFDRLLGTNKGRNDFEGKKTERIYTLVARDTVFQDIAEDPIIMALCDAVFMPNYLLTASQAIVIAPGETPQPWHTDDSFYPIPRPRPMISLSTIVAVDDFTAANGGTEIVPGSHLWGDEELGDHYLGYNIDGKSISQESSPRQFMPVEISAGTCIVFAGTLLHRGGGNNSGDSRRAFSNQYCQPWARPQENFFLGIPPEQVAAMSPKVQSLLGYSIHPPFMGQVTAYHPLKTLEPNFVAPVMREN